MLFCICFYVPELVMVVKKKTPKVEAVVLDDVKLKSLTGEWQISTFSGCVVVANAYSFL